MDGTGKLFNAFIDVFNNPDDVSVISYPMDRYLPYGELVDYVVSQLPKDKPLIIVGESYSGPVALHLATKKELTICGLILVATFAHYPISIFKIAAKLLPLSLLFRLPVPNFIIRHYCFADASNTSLNAMLRVSIKMNQPNVLAKRVHEATNVDVTHLLADIKVPCLVITASDDRLVPKRATEYIKKHLPDVQSASIPGPHFILQTQPMVCFEVIQKWVERMNSSCS